MARKKSEFPIGKQTANRYLRYPDEHWRPLTRSDVLAKGMVIRRTAEPTNPETLFYIITDQSSKQGMHTLRRVNGTRELDLLTPKIQSEYSVYIGPPEKKKSTEPEGDPATEPTPEELERAQVIAEQKQMQDEMKRAPPGGLHIKGGDKLLEKIKAGESTRPADPVSTGQGAKPAPKETKPRGRPRKTPEQTFKTPDAETIRKVAELGEKISGKLPKTTSERKVKEEEERLLMTACAALVIGSGSIPDAQMCEETFKDKIGHLANAVALHEITHDDAVREIVRLVKQELEKKGAQQFSPKETKRIEQLETSMVSISKKLDQMNNQMKNVILRWEQISPVLPTSHVQYYLKDRKKGGKGGKVGVTSYHTGRVEQVDTEKSLDEMDETLVLYIKNGLCFHIKSDDIPTFHELYADALDKEPEMVYGFDAETGDIMYDVSDTSGYDYMLCVDLTRRKADLPYAAAGGRVPHPRAWVRAVERQLPKVKIDVTDDAELA